jgi:hypothetical protein
MDPTLRAAGGSWWLLAAILSSGALALVGCDASDPVNPHQHHTEIAVRASTVAVVENGDTVMTLSCRKWPHRARAAVSITYDAPWGSEENHHLATDAIISRGLTMDIELVSEKFLHPKMAGFLQVYRSLLMPSGIHFFGHGHTHALHDTMEYDAAYQSFRTNFEWMERWRLNPKAYAYPGSAGRRVSTQKANEAAGFICARGCTTVPEEYYIVPYDVTEPDKWHYLPSVVMGSESVSYIHNPEQLLPILDEAVDRTAWIILMYHAIGIPTGWGYYPADDFERDLDAIGERDFWCANMDDVACYVKERSQLRVELKGAHVSPSEAVYTFEASDGLENGMYDQPLAFELDMPPRGGWIVAGIVDADGTWLEALETEGNLQFELVPDERSFQVHLAAE